MKEYKASVLFDTPFRLGESPFYDYRTDTLSWVDILDKAFYRYKDGVVKRFEFTEQIGSAVPSVNAGDYYLFATKGIYLLHDEKTSFVLGLTEYFADNLRCNDCKGDPMGRPFLGSSNYVDGGRDLGNLYMAKDGKLITIQPDTEISNGMAWNKDRTKFYFSDSPKKAVFEYDYDIKTGAISNRRVLCTIEDGTPDGMTIDSNDNLYVAIWGGSRVEVRSTVDGSLQGVIHTGANNTTSCCFYKDKLFITSSAEYCGDGGCCYICDVGAENSDITAVKF